jgi:hypothetical protein
VIDTPSLNTEYAELSAAHLSEVPMVNMAKINKPMKTGTPNSA